MGRSWPLPSHLRRRLHGGAHCGLQIATAWPRPACADVMWDWWIAETLKARAGGGL